MPDKSTFSKKMKELEEIVAWFDSDEVDLDASLEKFERGAKLAEELKADLAEMENKVKKVVAEKSS